MGFLDFFKRYAEQKDVVRIFDKEVPLRIFKGQILTWETKTYTRYFDKDGRIWRYGDGMDKYIVRSESYPWLEIKIKVSFEDKFSNRKSEITKLGFERKNMFEAFGLNDKIIYYGLYLNGFGVWTNLVLQNISNSSVVRIYFIDTINKSLFENQKDSNELKGEIERAINTLLKWR